MPDSKISGLTSATTPLAGTEVLPIVQGGQTRQVSVANLTAGRSVSVLDLTASGGNVTLSSTYELNHLSAASPYTAVRIGASNVDVVLLRVGDAAAGTSVANSAVFGFSLTYMGTRSGNANTLSLFSDNQAGSQVEALTVFQDGSVGIGTGGTITASTKLDVIGNVRTTGQFTNTVATGTAPFVISSTTRVSNLNVATAGTADTLTTARTINEVSFNGSANITVPRVRAIDDRTAAPADFTARYATVGFGSWNNNNTSPYADYIALRTYGDATGGSDNMVSFRKDAIGMRVWQQTYGSASAFATYKDVAFTDSSITGNAATATALQNTRTLWGQNFNGTANVTGSLTSVGNITGTAGVTLTATAGTLGLVATGANVITASTNGSERMRITSAGDVGIGTSSPATKLDVTGTFAARSTFSTYTGDGLFNANARFSYISTPSAATLRFGYQDDGGGQYNPAIGFRAPAILGTGQTNYSNAIWATTNGALAFGTGTAGSYSERMRITSAGDVGIGTSSPTNTLTVAGDANITGNTTLGDASTDTVTVNGYMGVGVAPTSSIGLFVNHTALTSASQIGALFRPVGNSAATTFITGVQAQARTAADTFTVADVAAFFADNIVRGSGSTVTNQHGVYVQNQSAGTNNYGITSLVSSGTNKWNIYASGTAANYFAGNVGIGVAASSSAGNVRLLVGGNSATAIQLDSTGASKGALLSTASAGGLAAYTYTGAVGSETYTERLRLSTTEAVFNDPGDDYDFRVESDTNTHALFVEGSSGNVGIGTSGPSVALQVNGTSNGATLELLRLSNTGTGANTKARLNFYAASTNYASITGGYGASAPEMVFDINTSAGAYIWNSNATERMRITSAGDVGIGTNSPSNFANYTGVTCSNTNGGFIDLKSTSATITSFVDSDSGLGRGTAGTRTNHPFAFVTNNTERMRIDISGNVGIGTSTMTGRVNIVGSAASSIPLVFDTNASYGEIQTYSSSPLYLNRQGNNILANVGGGNFGIGTASPGVKLDVVAGGGVAARVQNTASSADAYFQAQNTVATGLFGVNATGQYMYTAQSVPTLFYNAGTERLRITSAGDVGIGTSSPSAKLDVVGGVEATAFLDGPLYDSAFKRFTNPGGGIYTTATSSLTGAIRITFPVGYTSTMMRVTVKVFEYTTGESFDIVFGGYNYSPTPSWVNCSAYIVGTPTTNRQFTVRFGYDSTATKMVVYIGELASTWTYPQVYITEVQCGYSGFSANFATGWAIGFEASAFQNVTVTLSNPQVGYQAVAGDAIQGSVRYTSTTNTAGCFYGGTTTPTGTTRLNYSGYLYPTFLNLIGSADTTTAATHYFVEQSSDGFVRPKTIANVRTEIVTTAAVSAATAAGAIAFAAGSAAAPSIYPTGDTNTGIFFPAADTIAFSEGGAESMRITSAGNVGIGTSSLTMRLEVGTNGAGSVDSVARFFSIGNGGANRGAKIIIGAPGSANSVNVAELVGYQNSAAATATNAAFAINVAAASTGTLTERLRITAAGNIHTPAGSTTMTDGFIYIPAAAGAPTGVATAITGTVPLYYNSSANILYAYNSSWQTLIGTGTLPLISSNANGVVYLNSSSQATTSTALQFNGTELGVGVTPTAGVQIDVGAAAGSQIRVQAVTAGVDMRLNATGGAGNVGIVGTYSNHDAVFYTNATERARITAAGALQLSPTGGEGGELNLLNPTGGTVGGYVDVSTANNFRLWTGNLNATMQIGQLSNTGGNIQFYTEASEKMRLISDGSLGIGTSSPSQKLHVNAGNLYVSNNVAGNAFCLVYNANAAAASTASFGLWNDNGFSGNSVNISFYSSGSTIPNELRIANGSNAPITFYTNGSERMRITGGGNFLTTQAAHSTVNTATTLNITQVQSGIIVSTPATNITITLPTGTTLESYTASMPVGFSFELTIILVTGSGGTDITIAANGNTYYGGTNVISNGPATLRFRKTATNTFTVYRIA